MVRTRSGRQAPDELAIMNIRTEIPPSVRPAGPAEAEAIGSEEMLRFLDFLETLEAETALVLPLRAPDGTRDLMAALIRNHIESRRTTITSLASAGTIPYATALRRIEAMIAAGLILQRPRTRTGKTFTLHPSPELLDAWTDYARRVRRLVRRATAAGGDDGARSYFFGSSYRSEHVIASPPVLEKPLALTGSLRILVHADPTFMAMDALKRQFEQLLGVPIRIRALSIDRLRLEALRHTGARQSPYDIIACDLPWIGEFAERGVLKPLDEEIAAKGIDATDFHAAGWDGCRWRGRQYGVPIQTTPELLLYRTDVFAEAGLAPPETAADVLAAARRLHDPRKDLRGIAWNAARGTPLGHTFLFVMAAFGRPVLDLARRGRNFDASDLSGERMRPMIDTPEGRQVAAYLLELLAFSPTNILTMSWYERIVAYAAGKVAMAYGYTLLVPYFALDSRSPACGRTGFVPHPRGPEGRNIAPVGGYVLGIPANIAPERLPATATALEILASAAACKLYIRNGSLVSPRFSVSADPEVRAVSPAIDVIDQLARAGLLQYWPRPPAPEISDVIFICGEELHEMLRGQKSVADALATAQNRCDALMRANGHY
jgi:multiple sugar transport system substrate-binding protein